MVINKTIIREIEKNRRNFIPEELRRYLLVKYADEPFPFEYSEQDLYAAIKNDIAAYESGDLDITIKSHPVRWQEEREYLQELYLEKVCEIQQMSEYITELENMLCQHGLTTSKIEKLNSESQCF